MKRPIAILAVLAAIASVALPEFGAAQPQENLAACCQQNGKHMCVVVRGRHAASGNISRTPRLASLCPLWGQTRRIVATQRLVPNLNRPAILSALQRRAEELTFARSAASSAPIQIVSPRGPPSLF